MERQEMMNGLMLLYKDALQNIAGRVGYRAKPHTMNKRQLAMSIVDGYHILEWLDQDRRDWILDCIKNCRRSK